MQLQYKGVSLLISSIPVVADVVVVVAEVVVDVMDVVVVVVVVVTVVVVEVVEVDVVVVAYNNDFTTHLINPFQYVLLAYTVVCVVVVGGTVLERPGSQISKTQKFGSVMGADSAPSKILLSIEFNRMKSILTTEFCTT